MDTGTARGGMVHRDETAVSPEGTDESTRGSRSPSFQKVANGLFFIDAPLLRVYNGSRRGTGRRTLPAVSELVRFVDKGMQTIHPAQPFRSRIRRTLGPFYAVAAVYLLSNMSNGFVSPYLNLHLARIGLTGTAIGLVGAAMPLGGILGPPVGAYLADLRGQVASVISQALVVAAVAVAVIVQLDNAWLIAAVVFAYGLALLSVGPMLDATALSLLGKRRNLYGRIRVWGSVGFMLAASTGGLLASRFEIRHLLLAAVGLLLLGAVAARRLPSGQVSEGSSPTVLGGLRGLAALNPHFLRFAAIAVFGQMAEATQYTFFAIHVDRLGLPTTVVGLAWAAAVGSEVLLLWNMEPLLARLGPRTVIVIGFCGAALRWLLTSFTTHPVLLVAIQGLHCLTFAAVYVGTVQYIYLALPEEKQVTGQALFAGARAAFAGVAATSVVGFLSDSWSIPGLYIGSTAVSLIAAVAMALFVKDPEAPASMSAPTA